MQEKNTWIRGKVRLKNEELVKVRMEIKRISNNNIILYNIYIINIK